MCFSTSASFGAGIILTVIGIASIKKVQHPSQVMFASIPLIFAVQQFSEGFVWLSLLHPFFAFMQFGATNIFLFFAQILWPLWVPISILLLEKQHRRKLFQKILVVIGVIVSCYFTYRLITYNAQAKIIGYHIAYIQNAPLKMGIVGGILYIIATVVPQFVSHVKRMWIFGGAILISYVISSIFYERYVVSVWCFFASVISMTVFLTIIEIKKSYQQQIIQ